MSSPMFLFGNLKSDRDDNVCSRSDGQISERGGNIRGLSEIPLGRNRGWSDRPKPVAQAQLGAPDIQNGVPNGGPRHCCF